LPTEAKNVIIGRDEFPGSEHAGAQFEAILERALSAYHRDEHHGDADWIEGNILSAALVPVAREAFRQSDEMSPDEEVLRVLDRDLFFLGEGYHVITLAEPARRFVVKYIKSHVGIPPLAPLTEQPRGEEWACDYGVQPDGRLHPAIWQHIRSFELYGPIAVPNRIYLAENASTKLTDDERRRLERFRSIGIVRSLGTASRRLQIRYPDDFPNQKRPPDGVLVSVLVVQPRVIPLAVAIEREIRAGNLAAARDLETRYTQFLHELWRYGVSHLDFSILNVGITGSGETERFTIFDPHMGVIEVAGGSRELHDPLTTHAPGHRSLEDLLRAARDGSRWALWQVHQHVTGSS